MYKTLKTKNHLTTCSANFTRLKKILGNFPPNLVDEVKIAHLAMGDSQFYNLKKELKGANFKRSILVSSIIKKGEMLTTDNIRVARPGDGLPVRAARALARVRRAE